MLTIASNEDKEWQKMVRKNILSGILQTLQENYGIMHASSKLKACKGSKRYYYL